MLGAIVSVFLVAGKAYSLKSRTFWNSLIVLCTIGLVVLPVTANLYQTEVARWYLADATNQLDHDSGAGKSQLDSAAKWVEDITALRDYWLFKAKQAFVSDPESLPRVIKQAVERNISNYVVGDYYSNKLATQSRFAEAVDVLEASCPPALRQETIILNQLAYFRSLAAQELEIALADINKALESLPDNEAMRDTRAWVLFQMGRLDEALADANFVIESVENSSSSAGVVGVALGWLERNLAGPAEARSSDKILTQREAGPLWTIGTLYYHRAKILEALGRSDEAEADYRWLRERSLPTDDRLF